MNTTGTELDKPDIVEDRPIELVLDDAFIARFEKAADLYQKRYLPLCLRLTNEGDWMNHGRPEQPKYYLQASGAEKVATPLGVIWERPVVTKHERQDADGAYYEYEIEGIVHSRVLARYGWFTGNCSSRDQFFNARGRYDEGDIRKAAFSNWIVNAVTRLAGIRNPTPAMLMAAGLDPSKVGKIDYSGQGSRTAEQASDAISEAMAKRWFAIARQNKWTDGQMKGLLASVGIESSRMIKRNEYDELVAMVSKAPPEATTETQA